MNDDEPAADGPPSLPCSEVDPERVRWQVRHRLGLCQSEEVPTIRVGRYPIIKRIGRGGSGEVFAAYDEQLQREIALKILRPHLDQSSQQMAMRVLREARVLARLSHRNIVHAYEVGREDRDLFIAMEKIEGPSLEHWQRDQTRPWREILAVYLEAGRALQAAHRMGVIHRDFKPGNVLITDARPRRVCVVDWGLARPTSEEHPGMTCDESSGSGPQWAPTWTTGFTPKYAAPEQMRGEGVGPAADQFAFCVALFEALFKEPPFVGKTNEALHRHKQAGRVVPYDRGAVPERITQAVRRGMQASPDDRFRSMDELLEILDLRKARRWWLAAGIAAAGITAVGTATVTGLLLGLLPGSDPCLAMDERVDRHWNDRVRARIGEAFAAQQLPFADQSFDLLIADLDDYLERWKTDAQRACRGQDRQGSDRDRPRAISAASRAVCLDRRLHTVGQLIASLSDADANLVRRAPHLVDELPPLDDCADLPPPPATVPIEIWAQFDEHLGQADASMVLHDWPLALMAAMEARQLATRARIPTPDPEPELDRYLLEADLAVGRAQVRTDDLESGVQLLEDAGVRAEKLRDDRLAWRAWSSLGRLGRMGLRSKEKIREWLARADSAATRLDDERRSMMLRFYRVNAELFGVTQQEQALREILQWSTKENNNDLRRASAMTLTALLISSSRPEQAYGPALLAMELADEQFGTRHPDAIAAHINLAQVFIQTCRFGEAGEVLEPAMNELSSEPHPYHLNLLVVRAVVDLQVGRIDNARRTFEDARALVGSGYDARIEQGLGVVAFVEGDFSGARRRFERILEQASGDRNRVAIGVAQSSIAEVLLHDGRVHEALELAARARATLEDQRDLNGTYLAMALKVQGLGLLRHGELARAAKRLSAARDRLGGCEYLERADLNYALGLVAQRLGRADRGRQLLGEANAGYARLGELGRLRQRAMRDLLDSPG